jgi:ferredoxin-NADP reductase
VRRGPIPWRTAEVRELSWATPRVRLIRLHVPDWPGHLGGQHVDLRLTAEDGYQAQRSYSIASPPEWDPIELAVERLPDGEVSSFLADELRAGDMLELRGPLGGYFTWQVEQGGPLGLVAGGSGVVPLMAMVRHRAAQASTVPARLLCSWRTLEDVIYREELERLGARADGLAVTHTLTRATSALPPGFLGRRIDRTMLVEALPSPEQMPLLYVCGPTPMVESVASLLVSIGHPAERVKTERFGATGGVR